MGKNQSAEEKPQSQEKEQEKQEVWLHKPVKWEALTAIGTVILAIATSLGALGVYFAYQQLRDTRESTKVQHLVDEVRMFDSDRFTTVRRHLAAKRLNPQHNALTLLNSHDPPPEMIYVLDFFEHLGLLEDRGYLDKRDVWDEFGYYLIYFQSDSKYVILDLQKSDPNLYSHFQNMTRDVMKTERTEGGSEVATPRSILEFYQEELARPF